MDYSTHIVPVVVAAIAYFFVGSIWYSPALFSKPWMKMTFGKTKMDKKDRAHMLPAMIGSFIAALISACVIRTLALSLDAMTAWEGARLGMYLGAGVVATTMLTNALYEQKKVALFGITAGYHVLGFIIMGAILGAWG